MSKFFQGARVAWQYKHWIGRNWHWVVKYGTYERDVKKLKGRWWKTEDFCYVRFDGNKTLSRVPALELKWLEQE